MQNMMTNGLVRTAAVAALLSVLALPSLGQDPTPRWPDGHPNLGSAPGAKGYWDIRGGGGRNHFRVDGGLHKQ